MAVFAAVLGFLGAAPGKTVFVDGSFTGTGHGTEAEPYKTIQGGVNNAEAGDTIQIAPGTYCNATKTQGFQVYINKSLKLVGAGREKTVIDCQSASGGIRVAENLDVEIRDLTVCNAYWSNSTDTGGSCIKCLTSNSSADSAGAGVKVFDCTLRDSFGSYVAGGLGGVYYRCLFQRLNQSGFQGVYLRKATAVNCILTDQLKGPNGGYFYPVSSSRLINCTIFNLSVPAVSCAAASGYGFMNTVILNSGTASNYNLCTFSNCVSTTAITSNDKTEAVNCSQIDDPQYISPLHADFRLTTTSPLIDAGDAAMYTANLPSDVDADEAAIDFYGNPRLTNGKLALGAVQTTAETRGGIIQLTRGSCTGFDLTTAQGTNAPVKAVWGAQMSGTASTFVIRTATDRDTVTFTVTPTNNSAVVFNSYLVDGVMRAGPMSSGHPEMLKLAFPASGSVSVTPLAGKPLYVDDDAADGGDGSAAQPFNTLTDAVAAADQRAISCPVLLVKPGTYDRGEAYELGSNRVVVTRVNTCIRSTDGAAATIIKGASNPTDTRGVAGPRAVRCVGFNKLGLVQGFTLTAGRADNTDQTGAEYFFGAGGAVQASNARQSCVADCEITGNFCNRRGLAMAFGFCERCWVHDNGRTDGGPIDLFEETTAVSCLLENNINIGYLGNKGGLFNCAVVSNTCWYSLIATPMRNCISYGNSSQLNGSEALGVKKPMDIRPAEAHTNVVYGVLAPGHMLDEYTKCVNIVQGDPLFIGDLAGKRAYVRPGSPAVDLGDWDLMRSVYDIDGQEFAPTAAGKVHAGCSARVAATVARAAAVDNEGRALAGVSVTPAGPFAVLEPVTVTFTAGARKGYKLRGYTVGGGAETRVTEDAFAVELAPALDASVLTEIVVAGVYHPQATVIVVR